MTISKSYCSLALAAGLLPVMNMAVADEPTPTAIEIQFNGSIKAPTCTINDQTKRTVNLPEINLEKLSNLSVGHISTDGQQRFNLVMDCPSRISESNVSLKIEGSADKATPTILANTKTDAESAQGVGFELFSGKDISTPLRVDGSDVPAADYAANLNQGTDTIDFMVAYAKEGNSVAAGKVTSKATFTFTYK